MTNEELITTINNLQKVAYTRTLTSEERKDWSLTCLAIRAAGFKLSKRRNFDGRCTWFLKTPNEVKRERHFVCEWVNKDMSPAHKHLKGNCTTRAMAYILEGQMTYDEIEAEQYRLAARCGRRRNSVGVWDEVILNRGYDSVRLPRLIRRDRLAKMLKDITAPIITRSSGHVAIVHNGAVVDTWDSRGGRVKEIIVASGDVSAVKKILGIGWCC